MVDSNYTHSTNFDSIGDCNGCDLDDESDPKPLEECDSPRVSSSATHEGHEVTVIHGHREKHGEGDEAP